MIFVEVSIKKIYVTLSKVAVYVCEMQVMSIIWNSRRRKPEEPIYSENDEKYWNISEAFWN